MDYGSRVFYHYRAAIALNNTNVSLLARGASHEAMLAGQEALSLLENVVVHPNTLYSSNLKQANQVATDGISPQGVDNKLLKPFRILFSYGPVQVLQVLVVLLLFPFLVRHGCNASQVDKLDVKLRKAQKLLFANHSSTSNQPVIHLEVETHDCGFAKLDPVTKHSICVAHAIRIEPASFCCHAEEDVSVMVAIFLGNLGVACLCQAQQEPSTSLAEALQRNALQILVKSHDILVTKCNQEKNPLQHVQYLFTLSLSMENLIRALSDLGRLSEAQQCHMALIDVRDTIQRIKVKRSLQSGDKAAAA